MSWKKGSVREVAEAVAAEFPGLTLCDGPISLQDKRYMRLADAEDTRGMIVGVDRAKPVRVEVIGYYPVIPGSRHPTFGDPVHRQIFARDVWISVSLARGPAALVSEIRKRFLPRYEDRLDSYRRECAARDAVAVLGRLLSQALDPPDDGPYGSIDWLDYNTRRGRLSYRTAQGITFELNSVEPELVADLLRTIGSYVAGKHEG